MHTKSLFLLAAAILPAAWAQTHSLCNPLKGCFQDNPALGSTYTYDYTKTKAKAPKFDVVSSESRITYEDDGMHMHVQMKGDSPTLQSQFYIFWGRLDVMMKAGPGAGIVSSLVFQSDDLDEIDVEFIGSQPGNVQTNIFSKGNQDVHIYGDNHAVADAVNTFHLYTVDWTPEAITWSIDGAVVRTLTRAALGDVYPQTPMQVKFGPWAAGDPSNAPGTIEWAGGPIDYSKAPFDMVVQYITITDYSKGATKYRYGDGSGSSGSILVTYGGNIEHDAPSPSAAAPAPTTSTSTKPSPQPTSTKAPPPPPPTTTSSSTTITSTSTSTSTSSSSSKTSSSDKPETTSAEPETTSSKATSVKHSSTHAESTLSIHSTFIIKTDTEPTERADPTTFSTRSTPSPTVQGDSVTTSAPAGSGATVLRASSLSIFAFSVLFILL